MFSTIYYEQVALLHPPNRLASDETEEFLPKHVPCVYKDHIGKIHLALIPVGQQGSILCPYSNLGPRTPDFGSCSMSYSL